MNKPIVFSILAMVCYAVANVILEQKLSKFNNLTLMCVYTLPVLLIAVVGRLMVKTSDPSFDFPMGWDLGILVGMGFVFGVADFFYIGAYTNGGDLLTITSIVVLVPVFSSLLKFAFTHTVPNVWQVSGYILALCAVLLTSKGSMLVP